MTMTQATFKKKLKKDIVELRAGLKRAGFCPKNKYRFKDLIQQEDDDWRMKGEKGEQFFYERGMQLKLHNTLTLDKAVAMAWNAYKQGEQFWLYTIIPMNETNWITVWWAVHTKGKIDSSVDLILEHEEGHYLEHGWTEMRNQTLWDK